VRYLIVAEAYRDLEQLSSRLALTERLAVLLADTPAFWRPACRIAQAFCVFPAPEQADGASPHPHSHESSCPRDRRRCRSGRDPACRRAADPQRRGSRTGPARLPRNRPARRKAAADVLRQLLNACTSGKRQ
jgi:hypothetical protein